jgi:hypothetical protein|mmetsp:Transcript_87877/g.146068  ORF Transcript_87877/g.146068 Transcript_87877/m.146068 type:complete len:95 (+) Transcript_87877:751-1035(+)
MYLLTSLLPWLVVVAVAYCAARQALNKKTGQKHGQDEDMDTESPPDGDGLCERARCARIGCSAQSLYQMIAAADADAFSDAHDVAGSWCQAFKH